MFRECLKNNIVPFIVQNDNRSAYITALRLAQTEEDYTKLVRHFESEQAAYQNQCELFCVEERYKECVLEKEN